MEKRLADIDELRKDIVERGTQLSGCYSASTARYMDRMLAHVLDAVDHAPTIDAVPHWIPCEERLPENNSEVLVTDMNGHIRHAFYNAVWDRFGTYEESMTVRAIAWMPLPEPYVGERKDDE